MKWLIILLLSSSTSFAQQVPINFGTIFKDDSLVKVLNNYVRHIKSYDLQSNEVVVVLRLMWAHDDRSEWYFSTFTDVKGLQKSPPVLVSEVEHYPVVIYFSNQDVNPLLSYSTAYLTYLETAIYSKFKRRAISSPSKLPNTWRVILHKEEKTKVLVIL